MKNSLNSATMLPSYYNLWKNGELQLRINKVKAVLKDCVLCPNKCHVNRLDGETGVCSAGRFPVVANHGPHFGEEPPLVGFNGSGTIFFSFCNLHCKFCQNYDISHLANGTKMSISQLTKVMIEIQNMNCINLNLVTPTHFLPQILEALLQAIPMGLRLPIVYNCGGYESVEIIKMLDGIVDIYMPDVKFFDQVRSKKYLSVADYPAIVREVLIEMHHQVGDLQINENGIAERGLLVRHLVMPATSKEEFKLIFTFLSNELSNNTYVNIMDQYHPLYKARNYEEINRTITASEFNQARLIARECGLTRGFN